MTKRQKKSLILILLSSLIFIIGLIVPLGNTGKLIIYLASYILVGHHVLQKAFRNILKGRVFDENFLMALASLGAFFIGDYKEGVTVIIFYQIGELFEHIAVDRSRKSIKDLMDICPDYANLEKDGNLETVDPDEVCIDDIILIKTGEKVPLDGEVVEGSSTLDTTALTGETVPRTVHAGDTILSGTINLTGVLRVRVTKEFGESTVSKILDLVENASNKKAHHEQFITKFARYYTPIVVIIAAFLSLIPPLLIPSASFSDWIHRGLIFLVISCPCALVISVPLSFFGGIGAASKAGILIKGSNYIEALANAETVVFDKTGTLTKGTFEVTKIAPLQISKDKLLEYAAYAECYSSHPIALSLKKSYGNPIDTNMVSDIEEISGHGIKAVVNGVVVHVGNSKLMNQIQVEIPAHSSTGTTVHISADYQYAGYITISDQVKSDSKSAITSIKALGVKTTVMLTGDQKAVGEMVASELGIDKVRTELLPVDKVNEVEKLLEETSQTGKLIFVGDGINDAPVLTRSDIGIAMGGLGSDAAIEAADIVIMTDEPSKVATVIAISRKTLRIVKQNIIFALGVKLFILSLGAFGLANMWEAVFADVGVSVIAILNAMRVLKMKHNE
ncbi:heavy metal translocating P-type ATPase [Anaeromicropila populeti]|uniref:Cd(2+)-exporting ATPase n=1 Tax=Anaeromicropila populeti TaxID=37658 RepID=A0A1I6IRV1_9FIRM|nr:heavy metal translocating P-type ATPase [Anaeromicropila populeti]SFR69361.1 Cd2+/Zn2+-exporting ATPase [Anaeromicropila populeti]